MFNWSYNSTYTNEFEEKLKPWLGAEYVIATNSGTAALHLSLLALDIHGHIFKSNTNFSNYIITQALTFIATSNVIQYVGSNPKYIDVDNNQCISVKELTRILKDKKYYSPKAIIPVHLNRKIGEQKEICKLAMECNIPVIEDASQALGIWKLQGDCGAVSFNGNKIMTTGCGGAFCTNSKEIYEKAYKIVNIGRAKGSDIHEIVGYGYRMSGVNALRGLQELEKLPDYIKNKKPKVRDMYTPLTEFPPYKKYFHNELKNTYRIWNEEKALYFEND